MGDKHTNNFPPYFHSPLEVWSYRQHVLTSSPTAVHSTYFRHSLPPCAYDTQKMRRKEVFQRPYICSDDLLGKFASLLLSEDEKVLIS